MTAKEWVKVYEKEGREAAFDILAKIAEPYECYGIRPGLMLAQFLQESYKGGGQWSGLFLNQNNLHGIKSDKGALLLTQEEVNGELVEMNSTFAIYPDIDAAVLGYIKLMCGSRYFEVRAATTWQGAVKQLGLSPYATASDYGSAVRYWLEKYELYQYDTYDFYDRAEEVFNTTRFRDRGDRVFRVQMLLMEVGYDIQPNGIYDLTTFAMVKDFQERTGLLVDGVCGINTYLVLSNMTLQMMADKINATPVLKEPNGYEPIEEVDITDKVINLTDFVQFLKIESDNKKGEI